MRRVGFRLPDRDWKLISQYARAAGLVDHHGRLAISDALRDLISRGLVPGDRSTEAGYRSGYVAGRMAGYAEVMKLINGPGVR